MGCTTCACGGQAGGMGEDGHLHLWLPTPHTRQKLASAFADHVMERGEDGSMVLKVEMASSDVFGRRMADETSAIEREDSQVLFMPEGREPSRADFARMTTLRKFVGKIRGRWLTELLASRRIRSWMQPIVDTADTGRIVAYECLLRGFEADGRMVSPVTMLEVAREGDQLFNLDRVARQNSIEAAAVQGIEGLVFINFSPASIYDPVYCLQSTVETAKRCGIAPSRIVFEVVESDHIRDSTELARILTFYREAGFRIALDDLGSGYSSLNLLHALRPDFVKLDMALTRDVHRDPYKALLASKLLEVAGALGLVSIAEGIETAEEYRWVRDHGADYAQGYLFAKPAEVPVRETPVIA